jgi:hypothetical protein
MTGPTPGYELPVRRACGPRGPARHSRAAAASVRRLEGRAARRIGRDPAVLASEARPISRAAFASRSGRRRARGRSARIATRVRRSFNYFGSVLSRRARQGMSRTDGRDFRGWAKRHRAVRRSARRSSATGPTYARSAKVTKSPPEHDEIRFFRGASSHRTALRRPARARCRAVNGLSVIRRDAETIERGRETQTRKRRTSVTPMRWRSTTRSRKAPAPVAARWS